MNVIREVFRVHLEANARQSQVKADPNPMTACVMKVLRQSGREKK